MSRHKVAINSENQTTEEKISHIFLFQPPAFFANPETMSDNSFQSTSLPDLIEEESKKAIQEHRMLGDVLKTHGISTLTICAPEGKPDAIFPNNSFSLHEKNGDLVAILYPMSLGRQDELPETFVDFLKDNARGGFHDLRHHQEKKKYLEGTGVLNFSNKENAVFVGRSGRADEDVLAEVCAILEIPLENRFIFDMMDDHGRSIYHTNVINWIGKQVFAVCLASLPSPKDREKIMQYVRINSMTLLDLTFDEIRAFAGNALEVTALNGDDYITISQTGLEALTPLNREIVKSYYGNNIIAASVNTIQKYGGGSVRCMEAKSSLTKKMAQTLTDDARRKLGDLIV